MATPVAAEKVVYLLDPVGASRRSAAMRAADAMLRTLRMDRDHSIELPYFAAVPRKARRLGLLARPVFAVRRQRIDGVGDGADLARHAGGGSAARRRGRAGVRRAPARPGRGSRRQARCRLHAGHGYSRRLTVVGDGPVGAVGRQLDERFGMPAGHHQREWALGMKLVVDLPAESTWSRARSSTPSAIPSRKSSASSTCIRTMWPRSAFSSLRGSTARCARPTAICSTTCCTLICGAILKGGKLRSLGRQIAAGIGQARRAVSGGRRLCAHRRRLGQHQRADRLRRG